MDFYRSVPNRIHFRHTILRYTKFQQTSTVKVSKGRGWKVLESSAISVGNRFPLTCTRRFGKCFDQPGERRWTSRRKKAKANAGSRSERSAGPSSETRGAADWAPSSVSRRYSGSQQVRRSRPSLSASLKKKKKRRNIYLWSSRSTRIDRSSISFFTRLSCGSNDVSTLYSSSFFPRFFFYSLPIPSCALSGHDLPTGSLTIGSAGSATIEDTQKWTDLRYLFFLSLRVAKTRRTDIFANFLQNFVIFFLIWRALKISWFCSVTEVL